VEFQEAFGCELGDTLTQPPRQNNELRHKIAHEYI